MLTALGSKLSAWVVKYVVRYILDHFIAWVERRTQIEQQKKVDKVNIKKYNEAVSNGTEADIQKATEDLFSK